MDQPDGPNRGPDTIPATPIPEPAAEPDDASPPAPEPATSQPAVSVAAARRIEAPSPRVALVIAAAVVVGVVLYLGREALAPFVVGLLLVYLCNPAVDRLQRLRVPRWLAILLVYAVVVVVVYQAIRITVQPLVDQVRLLIDDLPDLVSRLDRLYHDLSLPPQLRQAIDDWIAGLQSGGGFDPGVLLPVVNLTAGLVSAIFGYLIIPVWAFYLLKDRRDLMASVDRSLPGEWRGDVWNIVAIVDRVFGQWIRGQIFLGVTVGVATFAGLLILNALVDPIFGRFALLLAIIAGILELLPIIGPIIAAIPAVLLAMTAGPQAAIAALVLYLLVQQVENNVLVPKIQGDAVQLHPSAVMFSLVLGGAIAGLLGAILALPVTAAARDVYRYLFRRATPA